jgi:hypothetical protein
VGQLVSAVKFIARDSAVLLVFEVLFTALFIYAFIMQWRAKRKRGVIGILQRGKESWQKLYIGFGIASLVIVQLISISEFARGYKVIISVIDLAGLIYLVFYNAWFRDKVIGLISKSEEMKERH